MSFSIRNTSSQRVCEIPESGKLDILKKPEKRDLDFTPVSVSSTGKFSYDVGNIEKFTSEAVKLSEYFDKDKEKEKEKEKKELVVEREDIIFDQSTNQWILGKIYKD